jgi:hypothetical protein
MAARVDLTDKDALHSAMERKAPAGEEEGIRGVSRSM